MFINPDAAAAELGADQLPTVRWQEQEHTQEHSDERINRCSDTTPASANFTPALFTPAGTRPLPALQPFSEKSPVYDLSLAPLPANTPPEMRSRRRIVRLFIYSLFFAAMTASFYALVADDYSEPGDFGLNLNTASRLGYKQLADIPARYIPRKHDSALKRLVVIGDVHGMFTELKDLLHKLEYDRHTDHLVFTGDVVSKGPDSLEVVDFARKEDASCVRGNQDDRILLHYRNYRAHIGDPLQANDDAVEGDVSELGKKMHVEKKLARKMTEKQAAWLESCPLILRANKVKGMGNVVVVHAGLVHGVDLMAQEPFAVMNMRSIHAKLWVPSANTNGMHWARLWNRNERHKRHPTTVIYGHYAARGLDIRPLTKGLDTNCVRGGNLTALVVSTKTEAPELISVGCRTEYS